MPFMEDAMLDLFGEENIDDKASNLLQQPQQHNPAQRSIRNSGIGLRQRIAWSIAGSIAYLSADGRTINLRALFRDAKAGSWKLNRPGLQVVDAPSRVHFIHLQWSGSGTDLIAVDQYERTHLYSPALALDRLQPQNIELGPPLPEAHTIVNLNFLPIHPLQFNLPQIARSVYSGDRWSNALGITSTVWPHHISDGKSAFLTVTAARIIKLTIQQDSRPWTEVSATLEDNVDADEVLTHASFADTDHLLYLVTFSTTGCLRLYTVMIEWSMHDHVAYAVLQIQFLHNLSGLRLERAVDGLSSAGSLYELYLLPPTVISNSSGGNLIALGLFAHPDDDTTTIVRLEIAHSRFEALDVFATLKTSDAKIETLETNDILRRLPDVTIPKAIASIRTINYDPVVTFLSTDGSVDFRHRDSLDLIMPDGPETMVESLAQSGFTFPNSKDCVDIAFSPSGCLVLHQLSNQEMQITTLNCPIDLARSAIDDIKVQATLNAVARNIAIMTSIHGSAAEMMTVLPVDLPSVHARFLVRQIYRIMQRPIDLVAEDFLKSSTRVLRDTVQSKVFAMQAIVPREDQLGRRRRDIPAKLVWISMNLKTLATSLAQTTAGKESPATNEIVSLRQSARWCVDVLVTILDDLWMMHEHMSEGTFSLATLKAFVSKENSPSLHLLLSATSRCLLRMTLEVIKHYFSRLGSCKIATAAQRVCLNDLNALYKVIPFKFPHLESLVLEVDNSVREAYKTAKLTSSQRSEIELQILVDGDIPEVLAGVCEHLTGKVMVKICESVDMSKILFWEVEWDDLREVSSSTGAAAGAAVGKGGIMKGKKRYDVLSKVRLGDDVRVRTCRRCGSVTRDYHAESVGSAVSTSSPSSASSSSPEVASQLSPWLTTAQKTCICLGEWMTTI